jgi:hypothetical protein
MVKISTPNTHAHYDIIPAETRNVQVSEEGYSISIQETESGDIVIEGLEGLSAQFASLLSSALELWKYGLVPA